MDHQAWKTFSVNDILASYDRRLRGANIVARAAKRMGLPADLLEVPLQQAYENAQDSFGPTPTVIQSDILECLSECIGALDDVEEAEKREIQSEERLQALLSRIDVLRQEADAWKEEADAWKEKSEAINKLRREERSYEKAQIWGLLIKGGCSARGLLKAIHAEIVDNLKLDHLKEPESAEETWQTMFNANESLLDVAKLVAKLDGKTISSAEDAAEEVSDIQKCLSDENIDWSRSLGRNSLGNFVCIPTPLLTKGQATLVYEMAKVYRYPAEIVDKDGQVIRGSICSSVTVWRPG